MKLFVPIIGSISAGKSTFLKGFLGINELDTGINVTTKFVCLIKNCSQTSFYHVILKKQNDDIIIQKEGSEIKESNSIKNKIKELNQKYKNTSVNRDELFYMLETPIKNIDNSDLLNNCIFMDIPGLNEINKNYIDEIFSIITLKNILFQIIIFDAKSFNSDSKSNIILDLDKKNCLQKKGNLYILNKFDYFSNVETPKEEQSTVDSFISDFYQNFDRNSNKGVFLNFYENYFVPMNSILYNAETKYEKDYCSWLIVKLFNYLKSSGGNESSFFEHLQNLLNDILKENNIKEDDIEKESNRITENEMNNIINSVNILQEILIQTEKKDSFIFGIKIEKLRTKNLMKKLYIVHEKKMFGNFIHSEFYEELQEIIKNIKAYKESNLPSPPPVTIHSEKEKNYKMDDILKEMKDFLKEKLENQFEELNSNLRSIEENIFGRKIRISFIGPISVGKSTVLNCIIGEEILPTDQKECTYRGIIIKHEPNFKEFYVYKVKSKVVNEHGGLFEFTTFIEEPEYYCKGIKNIKSFLTTKNNDKKIENDSEAFIVIKGNLKIFEYIKLDQELINKIEFVDLPGYDRKINEFNEKQYYHKILKFSNSCIYINEPEKIKANEIFDRMKLQYEGDKENIFSLLRPKFIDTCLFLINRADEFPNEEEKQKAKNDLIDVVCNIEPLVKNDKKRINISFFSAKKFFQYLKDYKRYVIYLENNPYLTLKALFDEGLKNKGFFDFNFNFKKYIVDTIVDKIDEDYHEEIGKKEVPEDFHNKLKNAFNQLYKNKCKALSIDNENIIIKTLYNIYILFKNKKFSNPNYSTQFFDDLKRMIINAENLQKENFFKNFETFFQSADELFAREIKKESEILKKKSQENYDFFINELIPYTEEILIEKQNIIIGIINSGKNDCINEIDNDLHNSENVLERYDYNLERAFSDLKERLEKRIAAMQTEQEKVCNNIIEDIKNRAKEKIKAHYQSQNIPVNEIDVHIEKTFVLFVEIFAISLATIGTLLGTSAGVGFVVGIGIGIGLAFTSSLAIGAGAILGLGLIGGLVVGGIVTSVGYFWTKYKKKNQYSEALKESREKLINKFKEIEFTFSDHYKTFKDALIQELKLKTEIYLKRINNDEAEWKEIQQQYEIIRKKTKEIIERKFKLKA